MYNLSPPIYNQFQKRAHTFIYLFIHLSLVSIEFTCKFNLMFALLDNFSLIMTTSIAEILQ